MSNTKNLQNIVKNNLVNIVVQLNRYLRGENVIEIKPTLARIGRGGHLPHWYNLLATGQSMPNLDGKTIGSVIEMTLIGVLEMHTFKDESIPLLNVNPAKGVDIPLLNLGVKSPSENYCTSEPFYSAYERLLGNDNDVLVLLTDYQSAKKNPPPIRIQILKVAYLEGSEVSDKKLCAIALKNRDRLLEMNETLCKKMFQFLCYVIQSDWRAKQLIKLLNLLFEDEDIILKELSKMRREFQARQRITTKIGGTPLSSTDYDCIDTILSSRPIIPAIVNACSDWVIEYHKDFGRLPNDNEWNRFLRCPLNGKLGLSFALQWRFNFSSLLRAEAIIE